MADIIYDSFLRDSSNGSIDLDTDAFKVMLVTSTYTASKAHAKRSEITNEVSGTGYTAGGMALTGITLTLDGAGHKCSWDAADPVWTSSTITARAAVVYKARGGASSADELVGYWDFGADKSSSNGSFTIQWNAAGLLQKQQG